MTYFLMIYLGGLINSVCGVIVEHKLGEPVKKEEWPQVLFATVFWPFAATACFAADREENE